MRKSSLKNPLQIGDMVTFQLTINGFENSDGTLTVWDFTATVQSLERDIKLILKTATEMVFTVTPKKSGGMFALDYFTKIEKASESLTYVGDVDRSKIRLGSSKQFDFFETPPECPNTWKTSFQTDLRIEN